MQVSDSFINGFFEKCAAAGMNEMQTAALFELWLEKAGAATNNSFVSTAPTAQQQWEENKAKNFQNQQTQKQPQQQQAQTAKPGVQPQQPTTTPQPQQPATAQQPQQGNQGGLINAFKTLGRSALDATKSVFNVGDNVMGGQAIRNLSKGWNDSMPDQNSPWYKRLLGATPIGMAWGGISALRNWGQGVSDSITGTPAPQQQQKAAAYGLYKAAAAMYGIEDPEMEKEALMKMLGSAAGFAAKRLPGMIQQGGRMLGSAVKQYGGAAKDWMQNQGMDYLRQGMDRAGQMWGQMKDQAGQMWGQMKDTAQRGYEQWQANAPQRAANREALFNRVHEMGKSVLSAGKDWMQNQGQQFMQGYGSQQPDDFNNKQ